MSDKVSIRGVDPEGVADGDYVVTVSGGHVTGLTAAPAAGGGGSVAIDDEGVETVAAASRLNFTGAGVTVTDAGSGVATVDIPGGGGGGGGKDRRWTIGSGETSIDEFNDASLDAAWVRVDGAGAPAANVTWAEGADALSMTHTATADSANALHALMRPISSSVSVGDAFVTCHQILSFGSTGQISMVGIALSDGVTYGSGKQVVALSFSNATTRSNQLYQSTNWNSGPAGVGNANTDWGMRLYVRLVCTAANTWRPDYSINGVGWIAGASATHTLTPTHVGLIASNWGTGNPYAASFEFVRRVSGVT